MECQRNIFDQMLQLNITIVLCRYTDTYRHHNMNPWQKEVFLVIISWRSNRKDLFEEGRLTELSSCFVLFDDGQLCPVLT